NRTAREPFPSWECAIGGDETGISTILQVHAFQVPRDVNGPLAFRSYKIAERREWIGLAMNQIGHRRWSRKAREPAHDFRSVGVGGHRVEVLDVRRHGDLVSVHAERLGAVYERPSSRRGSLVADKQECRCRIG